MMSSVYKKVTLVLAATGFLTNSFEACSEPLTIAAHVAAGAGLVYGTYHLRKHLLSYATKIKHPKLHKAAWIIDAGIMGAIFSATLAACGTIEQPQEFSIYWIKTVCPPAAILGFLIGGRWGENQFNEQEQCAQKLRELGASETTIKAAWRLLNADTKAYTPDEIIAEYNSYGAVHLEEQARRYGGNLFGRGE